MSSYEEFLRSKELIVPKCGFEPRLNLHDCLKPIQASIAPWMLRRGRAACFSFTGSGKTVIQCEVARHVQEFTGGMYLLAAPLAVAFQTIGEARKHLGLIVKFAHCQEECGEPGVFITNYQKLHKFDLAKFAGIGLDESSILKSFDGSTKKDLCIRCASIPYRHCYTATPAPNDYEELGNHAEFLGIRSRTEMLCEYFTHDGGDTGTWRLKGHAQKDFWKWVCDWAICVGKPSDLGHDDSEYDLPPLNIIEHIIEGASVEGMLFPEQAKTLSDKRAARRGSIDERIAMCKKLIKKEPDEPWLIWVNLNDEGDACEEEIPKVIQIAGADSDEVKERRLIAFVEQIDKRLATKAAIAGHGLNLQFCARNIVFPDDSYERFFQLIRRTWRYGQKRPVDVHVILSEAETATLSNIKRKQRDHEAMQAGMLDAMREQQRINVLGAIRETDDYNPTIPMEIPAWLKS